MAKRLSSDEEFVVQKKSKYREQIDDNHFAALQIMIERISKLEQQIKIMYEEYKKINARCEYLLDTNTKLQSTIDEHNDKQRFVRNNFGGNYGTEYDSHCPEEPWMSYIN